MNKIKYFLVLSIVVLTACGDGTGTGAQGNANASTGTGGSMARFSIVDNMLYAISENNIQLVNIEEPESPILWDKINVGFGIETLFTYDKYLFIGSQSGVFIYDYSNPELPEYISEFTHARSCDPVVVEGNFAFVTLRSNSRCFGNSNQLDILDISDIQHPHLVKTYPMHEPYGLGIVDEKLFICDGDEGLKVFDVSDKESIELIEQQVDVSCYDVIPTTSKLIVSSSSGIPQYNHQGNELITLSEIPVGLND